MVESMVAWMVASTVSRLVGRKGAKKVATKDPLMADLLGGAKVDEMADKMVEWKVD